MRHPRKSPYRLQTSVPVRLAAAALAVAALTLEAEGHGYRTEVTGTPGMPIGLYAEETGEGPPLLLIHGLGESTFTWRKIVPALARSHRVIALDLKGFGRSDKPLDEAYGADDQAALVAAFMEQRKLAGVTLVGHSFGGTVALRTALVPGVREEGRIRRLIVISAPALPQSTAPYLDLVEAPAVPEALTATMPPELLARILLREARGGGRVPEEDIKGYAAPYYELSARQAFLVTARSIVREKGNDIAKRYRAISEPSLLVWCRDDPIVPLRSGKRLAKILPNARLVVIKRCHHLPQDEAPEALMETLAPFLAH
jgi:pimeloyl-ACP methyl ester carboxylesterase